MTIASMSLREWLSPVFAEVSYSKDAATIQTHCLHPDGQSVVVLVHRVGTSRWRVTDAGNGWGVLRDHFLNPSPRSAAGRAEKIARTMGVSYHEGEWVTVAENVQQIVGSVLLIANATQAWVDKMMTETHHSRSEIIEEKLKISLYEIFGLKNTTLSPEVRGENKMHELSALVSLPNKKIAVFEVVTPHPSSIYPAYTKMMDVKSRGERPDYMEMVVENTEEWKSEDIALLRSASTSVIDINGSFSGRLRALAC
ncbi:MAG: hypothetical protein ABF976_12415 [Acetobacter syzygii]|uniref:hypothetical protein n=1 Tax=Acetobacter syzygii TaxID=146476 RepID=UPI0039E95313